MVYLRNSDKKFPRPANTIDGPFENIGRYVGTIVGIGTGILVAEDMVHYSQELGEHTDVIATTIKNHPIFTYLAGAVGGGSVCGAVGREIGFGIDWLIGNHDKKPKNENDG